MLLTIFSFLYDIKKEKLPFIFYNLNFFCIFFELIQIRKFSCQRANELIINIILEMILNFVLQNLREKQVK